MFHRHRSFFPLVLALLTILLIVLMVWMLRPAPAAPAVSLAPGVEDPAMVSVAPADYEINLAALFSEFFQKYDAADQDFIRVIIVNDALNSLLDLKVPGQYKELHLSVAVSLNQIRRGLTDEPALLNDGLNHLQSLRRDYAWLP